MKKIILGTVQFGVDYGINNNDGKPNYSKIQSMLDFAFSNNIIYLDSAEAYGNSHEIIGKYHMNSQNKFQITTKFCANRPDLPKNISERVHLNLKILNISNLYCYMFHSYNDYIKYYSVFNSELKELKNQGKVLKIGVSLHSNKDIHDVLKNRDIDLIQFHYNLLDNRSQRKEVILEAKKNGVEIQTRSTFLQGLFFKDVKTINNPLSNLIKYLQELKKLVNSCDLQGLALNYAISNSDIDNILIGVDNIDQLKKNLTCIDENQYKDIYDKVDSINVTEENLLNPSNW